MFQRSVARSLLRRSELRLKGAMLKSFREDLRKLGAGSVTLEQLDTPIALLTVRNPTRKNALDGKMMAELADAVDELSKWDGAAVVVTGEAQTWCSGADLSLVRDKSELRGEVMCALMQDSLTRLHQCDVISVAAVEDKAIGGGAEFTTACDHRILASDGVIHFVQAKMGVTPGWGGGGRLLRLVGRQRALRLLAGSLPCKPAEALSIGLVDGIADPGKAVEKAREFLQPYLVNPRSVVKKHKGIISLWSSADLTLLEREADVFNSLWGGDANVKAVQSNKKHSPSPAK